MLRPYLTDSFPRNVWPNFDFRDELLILVEGDGSIDSSEESQRLRRFFNRYGISFQSFCYVPPTEDLDLVNEARDEVMESGELNDKEEALNRAVHRLRRVRFHELLSIEAQHLNCSKNEVLSLERYPASDSTNLFLLTEDILWRVLDKLELIDLFRLNGVCRDWRTLVRSYVSQVERFEYRLSTHLLRFRNWLHHTSFSEVQSVSVLWNTTALKLTHWTTNLALNLKTLIINWPIAWDDFFAVSERCLKVKHLVCEYIDTSFVTKLQQRKPQFISQLECLVLQHSGVLIAPKASMLNLPVHASLTVYSITRQSEDFSGMSRQHFRMEGSWPEVPTQSLHDLPCFRLKYLRLGFKSPTYPRQIEHLGHCLENCPELLVLILEDESLVSRHVLRSIAKGCQRLKVVWIAMSNVLSLASIEELVRIRQSVLQYDPRSKFEEFHFAVLKDCLQMLKDRVPYSFIDKATKPEVPDRFSIKHPFIKNMVETPF